LSFFNELIRRNVFRVGTAYAVAAWLVIQVVETIFPVYGLSDASIRIVITLLGIGLIPVLIFAWVFEMTPEGLKKESEVDRTRSITPYTGKKLDRAIMVVLALALGYFAVDKFVLSPQREAQQIVSLEAQKSSEVERARQQGRSEGRVEYYGDRSIAVLPFVNMSEDANNEYFSDGISEELLNLLAKIPELRVISRSSAFSYKGKDIKLAQVAEELNVGHILEGSVRKAGNRVRITAQLIEARSDSHLWSETYDRQLDDIFAIQDEIAATVVGQLKITLLGEAPRAQENNPEAFALFLLARHLARQGTAEDWERSNALYRQALAIDPDYAAAWDNLSANYTNLAGAGFMPVDNGYSLAREAANKALSIDPDYAPAYASLGWIAMRYDNDMEQAARHYQRALQLEPSNIINISSAALLLQSLGRLDESIALNEYASARDPLNPTGQFNLGLSYSSLGRWDDALVCFETALRLSPGFTAAHYNYGATLLFKGEAAAALEVFQNDSFEVNHLLGLVMAYHALGETEASDAALDELIGKYEQRWAYNIAFVLAYRNEAGRAFEWLDKARQYDDLGLSEIVAEPAFANIHSDPRWLPFLASIGYAPSQLDIIEFKVTLP
jgi:TolB-like protein/lipoprotein NlpI